MKSIALIIFMVFFLATLGYSRSPEPSTPATEQNIIGEWTKKYFLQDGHHNSDPRWIVKMTFRADKKFIFDSISTQEEWLIDATTGEQTTKAIEGKTYLEGIYRLAGDKVFIKFIKDLEDMEKKIAEVNLGYDDEQKNATVGIRLQGDLLVLYSQNSQRLLYFEKSPGLHSK